jgi:hypothetical protein
MTSRPPITLKRTMGPSPPSFVRPILSPTFLAKRFLGALHCGHLNPNFWSSKYLCSGDAGREMGQAPRQAMPCVEAAQKSPRKPLYSARLYAPSRLPSSLMAGHLHIVEVFLLVDVAAVRADPLALPVLLLRRH